MGNSQSASDKESLTVDEIHIILEEYQELLAAGNDISIDEFADKYPKARHELIRLLPVAGFLGNLSAELASSGAASRVEIPPFKMIGDYQIVREIGRGGMGVVYEARQVSLDRRVALKVLPFAGLLSDRQLQRFKNEARAAASLRHPNIVNVLGVGSERSIHYYAMDFIDGADISVVIRDIHNDETSGKQEQSQPSMDDTATVAVLSTQRNQSRSDFYRSVAKLGIQVATALQFAHEEGVVHRDIKPANLLLDQQGVVHIADFGLARVVTHDDLTMTGDVVGTARYMSPEQLSGEVVVDQRTDIYSLGLTLYELLTGRPAFDQVNRAKLTKAIAERNPMSLRQLAPDVPRDLEKVIFRAIEKSSSDRYRSAREFAADLQRFVEHRPVAAQRPSKLKSGWKWCERNPLLVTAVTLVVVATLAGLVATSFQLKRARAAEASVRDELYAADIRSGFEAWEHGDIARLRTILEKYTTESGPSQDPLEVRFLRRKLEETRKPPAFVFKSRPRRVVFSPDGTKLACDMWGGNHIAMLDLVSQREIWRADCHPNKEKPVRFSSDGLTLAVAGGSSIQFFQVDDGTLVGSVNLASSQMATNLSETVVDILGFESDERITFVNKQKREPDTEERKFFIERIGKDYSTTSRVVELDDRVKSLYFNADHTTLAAIHKDASVWLHDPRTLLPKVRLGSHYSKVQQLAYSHDGRILVSTRFGSSDVADTTTRFWDVSSGEEIYPATESDRGATVKFSPSQPIGVAYGVRPGAFVLFDTETRTSRLIRGHRTTICHVAWSEGGRLATVSRDGELRVWDESQLQVNANAPRRRSTVVSLEVTNDAAYTAVEDPPRYELPGNVFRTDLHDGKLTRYVKTKTCTTGLSLAGSELVVSIVGGGVHFVDIDTEVDRYVPDVVKYAGEISLSRSGRQLAIGDYQSEHDPTAAKVSLFQRESKEWKLLGQFDVPSWIYSIAFSPDENYVAYGCQFGSVCIREIASGQVSRIPAHQGWVSCIRFSQDGRSMATSGTDNCVRIWDFASRQLVAELPQFDEVFGFDFSPDGSRIVTGSRYGRLSFWDWKNERLLGSMKDQSRSIAAVKFTPDGIRLVAAQSDGRVSVHRISGPSDSSSSRF